MKRLAIFIVASILAVVVFGATSAVLAETFTYLPPGDLKGESWRGRVDYFVYLPDMRFPVEKTPAYANSQVYGNGGIWGPGGRECDEVNYSYPFQDTFCERRDSIRSNNPLCPDWGHQGQDIRPPTCEGNKHWAVAVEGGTITGIGEISVKLIGDSEIRHRYLHLEPSSIRVWVGKRVEKGERIGKISDWFGGESTTYHLHFDMYSGGIYIPPYMSLVLSYEALLGEAGQPLLPRRAAAAGGADFDGNGKDDIFWYGPGPETSDHVWYSQGRNNFASVKKSISGRNYIPIAGDFDGDGLGDIFWYAAGSATDWIDYGEGFNEFTRVQTAVSGTYTPIAGDFDGNGQTDIFWYGPGGNSDSIWYYFGNTYSSVRKTVNGTYRPIAGDFDGDGKDDIFWYAAGAAEDWIYYGRGYNEFRVEKATNVSGTYTPVAGDFSGDGRTDIFWYGPGADSDSLWIASGDGFNSSRKSVSGVYLPIPGDFDGDGFDDIFWYGHGPNRDRIWFGTGGTDFVNAITRVSGNYFPAP